jgi:enamine deaminase RidA (YjgF/YER057c/UK114 family)
MLGGPAEAIRRSATYGSRTPDASAAASPPPRDAVSTLSRQAPDRRGGPGDGFEADEDLIRLSLGIDVRVLTGNSGRQSSVRGRDSRQDPDGSAATGPYAQARRALQIIGTTLIEAGDSLDDIVRTRIFVTDFGDFDEISRAHREVFGEIRPATSMVQTSALIEPAYVLEIEADAVIGSGASPTTRTEAASRERRRQTLGSND